MEARGSSETSVNFRGLTLRHIPEDNNFQYNETSVFAKGKGSLD
jgi:hypothetical protein